MILFAKFQVSTLNSGSHNMVIDYKYALCFDAHNMQKA